MFGRSHFCTGGDDRHLVELKVDIGVAMLRYGDSLLLFLCAEAQRRDLLIPFAFGHGGMIRTVIGWYQCDPLVFLIR